MNKISQSILLCGAFLTSVLTSFQIVAQPITGTNEFTLSGSGNSDKDFDNNVFALEGSWGYYLDTLSEVGIRQTINFLDTEAGGSDWSGATRVFYDYHFDLEKTRPYVGLGLGSIYGDNVNDTFTGGPELGLKYYVLDSTFIAAQFEYQFFFDDTNEIDDRFDDGIFLYSLGVGFNF